MISSAGEILEEWGILSNPPEEDTYDKRDLMQMLEAELGSSMAKYNGEIY
jgi:hypothetical protein